MAEQQAPVFAVLGHGAMGAMHHLKPRGAGRIGTTAGRRRTRHQEDLANTPELADRAGMDIPVAEAARGVMLQTAVDDARILADGTLRTGESRITLR